MTDLIIELDNGELIIPYNHIQKIIQCLIECYGITESKYNSNPYFKLNEDGHILLKKLIYDLYTKYDDNFYLYYG